MSGICDALFPSTEPTSASSPRAGVLMQLWYETAVSALQNAKARIR